MVTRITTAVAILVLLAGSGVATESEMAPVTVWFSVYMIDIQTVSSSNQSFAANLYYQLRWQDPELAHGEEGRVMDLDDVWNPRIQIVNQQKMWRTMPEKVDVSPEGKVVYKQRVWGTFSQPLDLREFPFDHQTLVTRFVALRTHGRDIEFILDPEAPSGISKKLTLADWKIRDLTVAPDPYKPMATLPSSPGFVIGITAERQVGYYVFKIILPLMLITAMSWLVFWIHPSQSSVQISVSVTSMLTLIAYRFMVSGLLPSISYLTRLDKLVTGATLLVFATLVTAIITAALALREQEARAIGIERWCRAVFPTLFGLLLLMTVIV